MEALQSQINVLSIKMDALYEVVERIGDQIADVLAQTKNCSGNETKLTADREVISSRTLLAGGTLSHKDVLEDTGYVEGPRGDHHLSSEVQIQRLTAQLTAAYNRIAALEEQLLAHRVMH
jgi:hypothetical protein